MHFHGIECRRIGVGAHDVRRPAAFAGTAGTAGKSAKHRPFSRSSGSRSLREGQHRHLHSQRQETAPRQSHRQYSRNDPHAIDSFSFHVHFSVSQSIELI